MVSKMVSTLSLGHDGAGSDCFGKTLNIGGKGLLAGAVYGTIEGCFLPQVRGSTTPMLFKSLKVILGRSVLGGSVLATFAAVSCLSAKIRDKDDYVNAFIGGSLSGSLFGVVVRSIPLGIGLAVGTGFTMATIKYSHNSYFPPLPSQRATIQAPEPWK